MTRTIHHFPDGFGSARAPKATIIAVFALQGERRGATTLGGVSMWAMFRFNHRWAEAMRIKVHTAGLVRVIRVRFAAHEKQDFHLSSPIQVRPGDVILFTPSWPQ